jgi:uncharacterized protein
MHVAAGLLARQAFRFVMGVSSPWRPVRSAIATFLVFAASFAAVSLHAAELAPVPPLTGRVTDLTGTLSAEQRNALEQSLAEFERK